MMSEKDWPQVNQPIEVFFGEAARMLGRSDHEADGYPSVVQDLQPGVLTVALPMSGTQFIRPAVGERVLIQYSDGHRAYRLAGEVAQVETAPLGLLVVGVTEPPARVQRRDFVRLDVRLPAAVQRIPPDGVRQQEEGWHPGFTWDLSGGGAGIRTAAPLARGDRILLRLDLPDRRLVVEAQVKRHGASRPIRRIRYTDYGVAFMGLTMDEEDAIVRFIFSEQRRRQREIGL